MRGRESLAWYQAMLREHILRSPVRLFRTILQVGYD